MTSASSTGECTNAQPIGEPAAYLGARIGDAGLLQQALPVLLHKGARDRCQPVLPDEAVPGGERGPDAEQRMGSPAPPQVVDEPADPPGRVQDRKRVVEGKGGYVRVRKGS